MTAHEEQVATIREALNELRTWRASSPSKALEALASLAAALDRAQQERDLMRTQRDAYIKRLDDAEATAQQLEEAVREFCGPNYNQGSLARLKALVAPAPQADAPRTDADRHLDAKTFPYTRPS